MTYLATDGLGRRVVIKMLEEDCLLKGQLHPLIRDRLARVRELAHVGVANLYGVERHEGKAFVAWEWVEGVPLRNYVQNGADLRKLGLELVQQVEGLHALGIVHGSLHAGNVIVTPTGSPRLTHISPLLHHDENVDTLALVEMLREIGSGDVMEQEQEEQGSEQRLRMRKGTLIGALLVALAGAALAWAVWRLVDQFPGDDGTDATNSAVSKGSS